MRLLSFPSSRRLRRSRSLSKRFWEGLDSAFFEEFMRAPCVAKAAFRRSKKIYRDVPLFLLAGAFALVHGFDQGIDELGIPQKLLFDFIQPGAIARLRLGFDRSRNGSRDRFRSGQQFHPFAVIVTRLPYYGCVHPIDI